MAMTFEVRNAPGTAPHAGRRFRVYVVRKGEALRYGKPADRDTVEVYDVDSIQHRPAGDGRPERVGQFVADYHAETLLADADRLTGGLNLYGGEPAWQLDGPVVTRMLEGVRRECERELYATERMADAIHACRRFDAGAHPERLGRLERATRAMADALFTSPIDDDQRAEWIARCGFAAAD